LRPAEQPALRRVQRPGSDQATDSAGWQHDLAHLAHLADRLPGPQPPPAIPFELPVPAPAGPDSAGPQDASPQSAPQATPSRAAPTAEEVSAHLRHELLLDRERAGSLADLW
jgi:hypothetical protein